MEGASSCGERRVGDGLATAKPHEARDGSERKERRDTTEDGVIELSSVVERELEQRA